MLICYSGFQNSETVCLLCCCSVAQLYLTLLWPCDRLPCPSLSPGICSNSCPLNWWCHLTISSLVIPFSSCLQSFPASGSFPVSWLFALGSQSFGTSASVLPMKIQGWFPLGLTGLISLLSKGLSRILFSTNLKASVLWLLAFFMVWLTSVHDYWKNHSCDYTDLCWQNDDLCLLVASVSVLGLF